MTAANSLKQQIVQKLSQVIDPETQVDVVRMRLIRDLEVDEQGRVSYTIQPSSPLCPVAVFLAMQIKAAVSQVAGVKQQQITIKNYVRSEELTKLINEEF